MVFLDMSGLSLHSMVGATTGASLAKLSSSGVALANVIGVREMAISGLSLDSIAGASTAASTGVGHATFSSNGAALVNALGVEKIAVLTKAAAGACAANALPLIGTTTLCFGGYMIVSSGWFSKASVQDDEDDDFPPTLKWTVTRNTLRFCALTDSVMAGIVVSSLGNPIAAPLRMWVLGGLVLAFPTSFLVSRIAERSSFRIGFLAELFALTVSFAWLYYGTLLLINSSSTLDTSSLLWILSMVQSGLAWSLICMIAIILITATAVLAFV